MSNQVSQPQLKRELGVWGATFMGLGSIIGTGIFVSIGIAAGVAGAAVVLAIAIGALVAICNGLSSAQLAANHPVSGGSYEYGYEYLSPELGFTAGWMFLVAKSTSAATAALGFAGYLLSLLGISSAWVTPVAVGAVVGLTAIVLGGIRRSNTANTIIVSVTLLALGVFVLACLPSFAAAGTANFIPFFTGSPKEVLQASALMFVAYTGYGRIATMGEEARSPRQTIPQAMIICLIVTMVLYLTVAIVSIGAVGSDVLAQATQAGNSAPLEVVMRQVAGAGGSVIVAIGAITAMLGVLLNLILGLSRVVLAMGRRRDLPGAFANLNQTQTTPVLAVIAVGVGIGLLTLIGNVKTTWSFSAFSVLIYYAITNFAALRLPSPQKLFPDWIAWMGLASCLFLAFWVDAQVRLMGIALVLVGFVWHWASRRSHN
ncbi:MAG: APC family permease [Leptolyngbyaceae cyanobacterium bins.302]|nr:APC family permease [Leptolyngbyaceae cyanobacterium bins.302]